MKPRRGMMLALASPAAALLLAAGLWAERSTLRQPGYGAERYHQLVRQAAAAMPYQIGSWVGADIDAPPAAVALLKPNVLLHRRFVHVADGFRVSLLLVQCRDARDLLGHYPPVCYVAHGWTARGVEPRTWQIGPRRVEGREYRFLKQGAAEVSEITIANFMLLPDGQTAPDMAAVGRAAENRRLRGLGAAQVQVAFDGQVDRESRDRIVTELLEANQAALAVIGGGDVR